MAASSLLLAACSSHVTIPPSELPGLSNASPGPAGPFPAVTTKGGPRKVVYGHLETVTLKRKSGADLVYAAPIRSIVSGERLVVRTRDDERDIPLGEITEVHVSYDDYLVRDRVAGGVLLGTGAPIFVGGVMMAALGLTEDLGGGAGAGLSLAGLGFVGLGVLMMMPGMVLAKSGPKKPDAAVSIGPGGIQGSF
ncbi:hypothetical protein GF068_30305 [Polyangium spumosum]|uniref:Uncharacterized protein n=1 Tax=Polyangium spumosum TaxID=889282 RepID=A0A6N7PVC1_9BACT|nr:hypothetical protein [Polyangium spumosum]